MKTNSLAIALTLSDQDLLSRIDALAGHEREATAELVAHLAALELRPSLYTAQGYGSLFAYCTDVLRLSEDAACTRIAAARACRDFPVVLDLLAAGSLSLTSIRILRPHLTPENLETILARARDQKKEKIEALVAELAPKPDVAASVRKLPVRKPVVGSPPETSPAVTVVALEIRPSAQPPCAGGDPSEGGGAPVTPLPTLRPRPVLQALAPERYRVQFTIGQEAYGKLRRLQSLLRREIPNGDAGVIFERFIDVLLDKVESKKLGMRRKTTVSARVRCRSAEAGAAVRAYQNRIRSGTYRTDSRDTPTDLERRKAPSRHIPNAVKRAVWFRDRAQCAFVAPTGHRCTERGFLELHHIHPYALNGPSTVGNIGLRCRRHNQYEAELVFGGRNVVQRDPGG